jgi:hypothetical protein
MEGNCNMGMTSSDSRRHVTAVLEAARRKLLETGTRNRLIHVNRANQRANCLNLINERSVEVYAQLLGGTRRMRFKAMGKDREAEDENALFDLPDDGQPVGAERQTDQYLETPLGPNALQRRLLRLATDARTAEEEQGINILYLSLGFLVWREDTSSQINREAPLILLPVELVRNERTSTYDIRCRDDDLSTNLPLQERLKQDFGLILPEIGEAEEWTPAEYFEQVCEVIAAKPGWSVDADAMQLGFFSFAKLLMHRDLDPQTWPEGGMAENELVRGLLSEGFANEPSIFGPEDRLDTLLDPAEIIQVIDADASQTKVIEEVRRGSSLVVQGPPGTGKSQTITNLIAAAAHDGKTVLFVAEKMAALSVVHDRLVKTGLRDICLELHSRGANKKALAQELGRTLMASTRTLPAASDTALLRRTRDDLNRISDLLHLPLAAGMETPFQAMSEITRFIGRNVPPPAVPLDGFEKLGPKARTETLAGIDRFAAALAAVGEPSVHPFAEVTVLDLQPTDLARLGLELDEALAASARVAEKTVELAAALGLPVPETLGGIDALAETLKALGAAPATGAAHIAPLFDRVTESRLTEALASGVNWANARRSAETNFTDAAWSVDPAPLRAGILRGQSSFFARIFGPYRHTSAELASLLKVPLPKAPAMRIALIDQLADVHRKRRSLADEEGWLQNVLGEAWRGERTRFYETQEAAGWLADVRRVGVFTSSGALSAAMGAVPDPAAQAAELVQRRRDAETQLEVPLNRLGLDLVQAGCGENLASVRLPQIVFRLEQMRDGLARYADWTTLSFCVETLVRNGAEAIVDAVAEGRLDAAQAQTEFSYACAEARWRLARTTRPELNELATLDRHDLVAVFRGLERDRLKDAQSLVLARHFEQMPKGHMGEMAVIRGEIARKRGHKSIRWVMKNAGSMLQRIKPVMLMSPISVAQFLPPGSVTFDLLVIDEASQIRPEDALGVVARARQIVVVGDQKQLPPTSFFDRLVDDVDENESNESDAPVGASAADMESILTLCEARGLRQRMLEWHYRSRDPSLIRVSNAEFYGNNLVLPPSPLELDENYGLKFRRVPGVYSSASKGGGRAGTNKIEAQEIVAAMARHARDWPDLSLGVVAFSKAQANMLTEVLEHGRRQDAILDSFLREGQNEDVFVKNIENVQGDERDVILISVGYGPHEANGRLSSMTFGPVNGEGGERRLNVLFSRARVRCEVFASFDPGDIDPSRTLRDGPRVLKRFLDFAKTGIMDERVPTGLGADSPFEEDVAEVIRSLGFEADAQVGSAGFRIDLGVRHPDRPGQYIAAVECDGATYHSAIWARERDRLRQDILENLGWQFHRIWSTDWFHRRDNEIRRLSEALEAARQAAGQGIKVLGANIGREIAEDPVEEPNIAPIVIDGIRLTVPAYQRANIRLQSTVEPHAVPIPELAELVSRIVEIEGPIHIDEVARRVSAVFGKTRTGNRIIDATVVALKYSRRKVPDGIRPVGDFWLTSAQTENPPVRDRSAESGTLLKSKALPPMEIAAAARLIASESGEMLPEDMVRAVARLLGFLRVGTDLHAAILSAIER